MVSISRQYSFGADKAVQVSQAVFLIKGHNPNFDTETAKSPYFSGYQIFIMNEGTIYPYTKALLGKNCLSSHSSHFVKKYFF